VREKDTRGLGLGTRAVKAPDIARDVSAPVAKKDLLRPHPVGELWERHRGLSARRAEWRSPAFVDIPTGASMRLERAMARRKRRKFTDEFKADAVKLCAAGGRSVTQVAADLDLTETALREWVKRAEADAGKRPLNVLTTAERDELSELRKRVKRLEMEREILKKAAAFFAKENA